jgi:nucleoid DNA-binding protein
MTMTKKTTVQEIGRRTRLKNRDVKVMLETLVEVWTEELVSNGRIELENLFILETQTIDRGENAGAIKSGDAPRYIRRVILRVSKRLKRQLLCSSALTAEDRLIR